MIGGEAVKMVGQRERDAASLILIYIEEGAKLILFAFEFYLPFRRHLCVLRAREI